MDVWNRLSDSARQFVERGAEPVVTRHVSGDLVVAAAQVLYERMPGRRRLYRPQSLQSAYRPQPGFKPTVVSFDRIVGVPVDDVPGGRQLFVEDPRIGVRAPLRWLIGGEADLFRGRSDHPRQLLEGHAEAVMVGLAGSNLVVSAAHVLDEGVPGSDGLRGPEPLQPAHRSKPGFGSAVVSLDRVVRVWLDDVERRRNLLIEDPRICGCSVGRHLDRTYPDRQRPGEGGPGCRQVAAGREHDVDDLTVVVDRPVQLRPPAGDLDVGLVDEPAVTRQPPARPGGFDELSTLR